MPLSINSDVLRILAAAGDGKKLIGLKSVAVKKLDDLGLSFDGAELFSRKAGEPLEASLNERSIVNWIRSIELPVRGEAEWIATEKTKHIELLKSLAATLVQRLG